MRTFFCAGPAFMFSFPLMMIGFPIVLSAMFFIAIFCFGWQVTDPHIDKISKIRIIK